MFPTLRTLLFPEPARRLPYARAWNIALRTAHLAATGILLGGHVFAAPEETLRSVLFVAITTGAGLIGLEAYATCRWFAEGRGMMVLTKLGVLGVIPFFWDYRVPLLLTVLVLASVGSHMPSRFRHYSLVHQRVVAAPQHGSLR